MFDFDPSKIPPLWKIPKREPDPNFEFADDIGLGYTPEALHPSRRTSNGTDESKLKIIGPWVCYRGRNRVEQRVDWGFGRGLPGFIEGVHFGTRTYVIDHCTAPLGVRCRCQREDHDPGDEDRRSP